MADHVLITEGQLVLTLERGPVTAGSLLTERLTVLSYDSRLCRFTASLASAESAGEHEALLVAAGGGRVNLVCDQPLLLSDGTRETSDQLAPAARLFGVTLDYDEDGDVRVHLRDGLKGKAKLSELRTLPSEPAQGARIATGIKADRAVEAITSVGRVPTVLMRINGPQNVILWPEVGPVGSGILTGV